jgi:hypothetical protein
MFCKFLGMRCLANHNEVLETALQMPNSDFSDLSDSDLDGGPPVSLNCSECKKNFKSTDRGCDTDDRTCSTCTKKAYRLLTNAFMMVGPAQHEPSFSAAATATTKIDGVENGVDNSDKSGDSAVNGGDDADKSANTEEDSSNKAKEAAPFITTQGEKKITSTDIIDGAYVTPHKQDDEDCSNASRGGDDGSSGEESEGSNKFKKKAKKGSKKKRVSDYDADVDDLLIDEASIEVICGGRTRTFVRKTFRMDRGNSIRLYCDLELLDELPLLYSYFVLCAHVNPSLKRGARGFRVVQDQNGKKWLVLCVFRSKCPNPRYDVIVLDPAENDKTKAVTRMCGLTNFFKWFKYIPDEEFDNKYAIEMLKFFLEHKHDDKGRSLIYDATKGPNKDEMGRPMSDGYNPANAITLDNDGISPAASKRVTKPVGYYADEQNEDTPWVRKQTPRARGKRGAATKKKTPPAKQKVSIHSVVVMHA